MSEELLIKTRRLGEREQQMRIDPKERKAYEAKGWVDSREKLPDPATPDLEVLALKVSDREREFEVAQNASRNAENLVKQATEVLQHAKDSIEHEKDLQLELAAEKDRKAAFDKAIKILSPGKPIPSGVILAAMANETQARFFRDNFMTDSWMIGKTESGESLLVANKIPYLAEQARLKDEEEKAKQAAIRARLEAQDAKEVRR